MKLTEEELDKLIDKRIEEKRKELKVTKLTKESEEVVDESVENLKKEVAKLKEDLNKPVGKKVIGGEPEDKKGGFKTFGEYILSVRKAYNNETLDPRLKSHEKTAGHFEEGQDSLGGFLVPEEYRAELLALSLEEAIVRPNAFVLPVTRDNIKIPRITDTSHASSVFGGVVGTWTAEAAAKAEKNMTFGQVELQIKKLTGFTYCSDELLADSAITMDPLIKRMFSEAIKFYEDDAYISGTGSAQPLGITNAPCIVAPARNSTSHFQIEDVANMMARLLPQCYSRAVWLVSPAVIPEIIWMENSSAGTGGHCVYISQEQGITKSPFPITIMGRPVYITEKVPTLGTANDVMLVDFSFYLLADKQDLTIETSREYRFLNDETTYRFVMRVDGQPWLQSALTPKNSGDDLSPIVGLAA